MIRLPQTPAPNATPIDPAAIRAAVVRLGRADGGTPLGKVSDGAEELARNYGAMSR